MPVHGAGPGIAYVILPYFGNVERFRARRMGQAAPDLRRTCSGCVCLDRVKMVSVRQRERERLFSGPGAHREGGLRNGSPGGRIGCRAMPCLLPVAVL